VALASKRDELRERFDDALELKSGIDRRRSRLDAALRDAAAVGDQPPVDVAAAAAAAGSPDELCRLRLDAQWVDDRVDVSHGQLTALMDNIVASSQVTDC